MQLSSSHSLLDGLSVASRSAASAYSAAFLGTVGGTSTSSSAGAWPTSRGKAEKKLNNAVGLPLRELLHPHGQPASPQRSQPTTPIRSQRTSFATSGVEVLSPSRSQPVLSKGGSQQRLLATAFDSDWKLKAELSPAYFPSRQMMEKESKRWLSKVLGTSKKKRAKKATFSFPPLSPIPSPRPKPAKFSSAWDPLRSLQENGLPPDEEESESSGFASESCSEEEPEADEPKASKARRRRSICMTGGTLTIAGYEKQQGPDIVKLSDISHSEGVPYDLCKQALRIFLSFAPLTVARSKGLTENEIVKGVKFEIEDLGSLDEAIFEQACCKIAGVDSADELGEEFMETAMASADRDSSGEIDYVEFLAFYQQFSFSEEILIGKEERQLRKIARKHGLDFIALDKYKAEFDKADTDRSGEIEYEEFCQIVLRLMKVPKGQEFPEKRLKEMWREAKDKRKDSVDFDGFIGFSIKFFSGNNN
eukprot:TRINITY_DN6407_c0_g2_i1.p1 TRINITY_DN6407_c0_g2~~TRINITY_DN6407_c0_g2_i1.p1  ORF type:complete len:477 (+),score=79.33 TRINITY_DN6407_c0_g2_i1:126-1556(+)